MAVVAAMAYTPLPHPHLDGEEGTGLSAKDALHAMLEALRAEVDREQYEIVVRATLYADAYPFADADQSPVPDPFRRGYMSMMRADVHAAFRDNMRLSLPYRRVRPVCIRLSLPPAAPAADHPARTLHAACYHAAPAAARAFVAAAEAGLRADPKALVRLLEARKGLQRFTPLHFCCLGAERAYRAAGEDEARLPEFDAYVEIAELLLAKGARVDSRDVFGFTPLAVCTSETSNAASLKLVPLLLSGGADVDARNRFAEALIVEPLDTVNVPAFRALARAGADMAARDFSGIAPMQRMQKAEQKYRAIWRAWFEVTRENSIKRIKCATCNKPGASRYCSACRRVYYCSKACQVRGWKTGHKEECGKDDNEDHFLDINVDTMTSKEPYIDSVRDPTGPRIVPANDPLSKRMKPRQVDVPFAVCMSPAERSGDMNYFVSIMAQKGEMLLVTRDGKGAPAHKRLMDFMLSEHGASIIFVWAQWLPLAASSSKSRKKKKSNILRVDLSRILPPPKRFV